MEYKVLYRKYRPIDFDNLVGQETIVTTLRNSIINNKLSHAFIFSGPRGTGKTSSAKIFAKNINCLNPKDGNACGECVNCKNFETSSDIIEIDAASNNGVGDIREITNNIKLTPSLLKYKVYIIDEFHMLSTGAFNALLLTLEEPPKHVIFILATTNIESVPITILSRCQKFEFKKITIADISKRLRKIADLEQINVTDEALELIAKISDGGLRDSLGILDQLSKEDILIDEDMVMKNTGQLSNKVISDLIDCIENNDVQLLSSSLGSLFDKNADYKILIKSLVNLCAERIKNIIVNNTVNRLSVSDYKKLALDLTDVQNKININVEVESILFIILSSYIDSKTTVILKEPIKKSEVVEESKKIVEKEIVINKDNESVEKTTNYEVNNNKQDILINNCFALACKDEKLNIVNIWDKFINEIDIVYRGKLLDTTVAMASKKIITIIVERINDIDELNEVSSKLENSFNDKFNDNKRFVFISKNSWLNLVQKYKNDRENGIIYKEKDDSIFESVTKVDDIFDIDKIVEE